MRSATREPTVPSPIKPTFKVLTATGAILPGMARVLREADVARVIEMDAVIAAVTAATRDLAEGKAQNEPRRRAFAPRGFLNVMFAAYPGGDCLGLKAYSVADGAVRFLVTVFGLDGALKALIEAENMGAYRTGAASAVAARVLAPRHPLTVGLIGAGRQARTQALALSRVLEIAELRVFSRDQSHRESFAAEQATSSTQVLEAAWVEGNALVIGAGSNFANRTELPTDLITRAKTIVVDQLATARIESGDLIAANAAGSFDWERATELGTVLAQSWKAPEEPGITVFESHGLALWDLAAASVVLPAAIQRGLGEEVSLF
ncbi:MAG: ornithine cyclodeaminase family protein [Chloroflexi bacterium]|nr:MAG: ornithine cyclodeaminase family protein [Chloroflexota bacterium]